MTDDIVDIFTVARVGPVSVLRSIENDQPQVQRFPLIRYTDPNRPTGPARLLGEDRREFIKVVARRPRGDTSPESQPSRSPTPIGASFCAHPFDTFIKDTPKTANLRLT